MSEIPVAGVRAAYDLEFSHDGTKLFVASRTRTDSADSDNLFRYDLTTPYDISTCQFAQEVDLDTNANLNDSAAGDFSRVDEVTLGGSSLQIPRHNGNSPHTLTDIGTANSNNVRISIFAVSYNILRIMSGMGGLAYSE